MFPACNKRCWDGLVEHNYTPIPTRWDSEYALIFEDV